MTGETYELFENKIKTIQSIGDVRELLHWDQHVVMPEKGITARSRQKSELAKIYHQKITSNELADILMILNLKYMIGRKEQI